MQEILWYWYLQDNDKKLIWKTSWWKPVNSQQNPVSSCKKTVTSWYNQVLLGWGSVPGNFLTSSREFNFLAFFHPRNKKSRILKKFRHFTSGSILLTFSYPSIFQCVHYCGPIRIVRIFLMAGECVYLWQSRKEKNIELNDGIAQYGICSTTRETIQEFRIGAKMGCSKT